ncbi:MAG: substrate-binding domain-containing protein, partial [Streptosporangiaceae bacterium]
IALGAWTEITARGLVPGRDLAVIGFDDSAAAAALGLTSVAQPLDEVADACLVALGKLLSPGRDPGKRAARPRTLLEPHLVVRGSSVVRSSSPSPEKRTS